MKRLAIISTHPIQYNAPLFRLLYQEDGIQSVVFFSKTKDQVKFDPDFQREVIWDIPVTEGYDHVSYDASNRHGRTQLSLAINNFNPHALLVYGWNFPGHLNIMRTFHNKVPIWFRGDSHLLDSKSLFSTTARRLWLTWVYQNVNIAFTVGSANEAYFRWCSMKPQQLIRAPHAVDNQYFQKQDPQRRKEASKLREELGIHASHKVVLYAGKLEAKKNPQILIDAIHKLDQTYHVIIAGTGPLLDSLKIQCAGENRVHFLGFKNQSEMPVIYRMADLFCLPSLGPNETWGLSVNEAIVCGIPVLASIKAGCSKDVFIDESLGVTIEPDNLDMIIKRIKQYTASRPNQQEIKKFTTLFSYTSFIDQIKLQCLQLTKKTNQLS